MDCGGDFCKRLDSDFGLCLCSRNSSFYVFFSESSLTTYSPVPTGHLDVILTTETMNLNPSKKGVFLIST